MVTSKEDVKVEAYVRKDMPGQPEGSDLTFNRCSNCGCVTHWWGTGAKWGNPENRMGVNCRLMGEKALKGIEKEANQLDSC
jgi:hypothetical protein